MSPTLGRHREEWISWLGQNLNTYKTTPLNINYSFIKYQSKCEKLKEKFSYSYMYFLSFRLIQAQGANHQMPKIWGNHGKIKKWSQMMQ